MGSKPKPVLVRRVTARTNLLAKTRKNL